MGIISRNGSSVEIEIEKLKLRIFCFCFYDLDDKIYLNSLPGTQFNDKEDKQFNDISNAYVMCIKF